MGRPGEWFRRVGYLLNRRRNDALLREEMEAHRAMLDSPAGFGNGLRLREDARDAWGWRWLDAALGDARLAVRLLARNPGFTLVAVASLALGFVLVTSTLAVVNAYLFQPLPYAAASRLYNVMYAPPGPWEPGGMSQLDWNSVSDVVEFPITAAGDTLYLADGAYAQPTRGLRVSHSFVQGLGVRASLGRVLDEGDWHPEADRVAMIGYTLWRDRYGSDPRIVGTIIRAETESRPGMPESLRVVGVLAPDFYFGRDSQAKVDVMVPLSGRTRTYLVRLREGVPPALAERRITEAARAVATDLTADWTGVHLDSTPERYVGGLRPVLRAVTGAAVLIMALVCANVGVLTLLRARRRDKEMAIRLALGSGRWQLTRMLGIEAALVSGAATMAGLTLAHLTLRLLAPVIETRLGRPAPGGAAALTVDGTVLLLVGGIGVLVALSLAFLPVFAPWQRRIGDILRRDRASSSDVPAARRLRSALLSGEVALTVILLAAGGLLLRSTISMMRTDLGFDSGALVRSRVELRGADYPDGPAAFRFYEQFSALVSSRVQAPLVFSSWPPFAAFPAQTAEADHTAGRGVAAGVVRVGGGYFTTVGIRMREGRDVTPGDERGDAPVAVVSETLARRLWPEGGAIGRRVRAIEQTPQGATPGPWHTVVGVAADVRQDYVDDLVADLYLPFLPEARGRFGSFYVRTDLPPGAVWPVLRSAAAEIDPRAIVSEPRQVAAENQRLESARFLTTALGGIAIVSVLLAVLGIYAVTAFSVRQRAREVAVRMALGATAGRIRYTFLREIGLVLAVGVSIGLAGVVLLGRLVESYLYGVPARDVGTLAAVSVLLVAVGLLAAWRPIRRASLESPVTVLTEG